MPGKHRGQILIGFWVDSELLSEIDGARARSGAARSQFIREALYEELKRNGCDISKSKIYAPDRAGKAVPRYPAHQTNGYSLNDAPPKKKAK